MGRYPSSDVLLRNPITGIAGCCARAASGHAAALPSSVMNERRLIGHPSSGLGPHITRRCGRTPLCITAKIAR
jgi:hypothetical protein